MTSRRQVTTFALTAAALAAAPQFALAQGAKLKVAAIYTVPFEQQWVSRIHKALKATLRAAASTANDSPTTS